MESKSSTSAAGGIGFGGALCLLFVALKLTGVINWSWWWVTAPLWIPFAVILFLALLFGVWVMLSPTPKSRGRIRSTLLPLVVGATLAGVPAQAALGPSSPPPGLSGAAGEAMWKETCSRASGAARIAASLVKGSSLECLEAVFLKALGHIEAGASGDGPEMPITVADAKKTAFRDALEKNRDDQCGGPPDGGRTVEAMATFSQKYPDWDMRPSFDGEVAESVRWLYAHARPTLTVTSPGVLDMLRAGILVPALGVAKGIGAAAGALLPIPNPTLFGKQSSDPRNGT